MFNAGQFEALSCRDIILSDNSLHSSRRQFRVNVGNTVIAAVPFDMRRGPRIAIHCS